MDDIAKQPAQSYASERGVAATPDSCPSTGSVDAVELHTDGSAWVACSDRSPKYEKTWQTEGKLCRVYHPDARETATGNYGGDSYYNCPNCGRGWWVERDG